MNFFSKLILGMGAVLLMSNAFASSNEWGNGGHGVRCVDSNGKAQIRLLDLYEETGRGSILSALKAKTLEEALKEKITELKRIAPKRALRYEEQTNLILKNYRLTGKNEKLVLTQDVGYTTIENNCELIQLGMQIKDGQSNVMQIVFQANYWNELSLLDKSALVLHEAVLLDLAVNEERHPTTQRARELIGQWFSEKFTTMSERDFVERLVKLNFKYGEYKKTEFSLYEKLQDSLIRTTLNWNDKNELSSFSWTGRFKWDDRFHFECINDTLKGSVYLNEDGDVSRVDVNAHNTMKTYCPTLKFPLIDNRSFYGELIASSYEFVNGKLQKASRPEPLSRISQNYYITDKDNFPLLMVADLMGAVSFEFDSTEEIVRVTSNSSQICGTFLDPEYKQWFFFAEKPVVMEDGLWKPYTICTTKYEVPKWP